MKRKERRPATGLVDRAARREFGGVFHQSPLKTKGGSLPKGMIGNLGISVFQKGIDRKPMNREPRDPYIPKKESIDIP